MHFWGSKRERFAVKRIPRSHILVGISLLVFLNENIPVIPKKKIMDCIFK
jgi:hypothetical protein